MFGEWRALRSVFFCLVLAIGLSAGGARAETFTTAKVDRLTTGSTEKKKTFLPEFKAGNDSEYVKFSGHINKGVLVHDDGNVPLDYWFVDGSNSPSRARIQVYSEVGEYSAFGGTVEGQWNPYATNSVNQLNRGTYDWRHTLLRVAEGWIGDRKGVNKYGRLSFGQGQMATDLTAEVDLSGTFAVAYSGVGDLAGGQFFRVSGTNALSPVRVRDGFANLDGFGRALRVRYDTPRVNGFKVSTSYGTIVVPTTGGKPIWDLAVRYKGENNGTKFAAALGFGDSPDKKAKLSGSASVVLPSYVNFTGAFGVEPIGSVGGWFVYGKAGYIAHLIDDGTTHFSIDVYYGENFNSVGSQSVSYGAQVVQNLDYWKTELYLSARLYQFSEVVAKYRNAVSFLAGARIFF